jgi:hypothetical protein
VAGRKGTVSTVASDHNAVRDSFDDIYDDAIPAGAEISGFLDQKKASTSNAADGEGYRDQAPSEHPAPESSYVDTVQHHTPHVLREHGGILALNEGKLPGPGNSINNAADGEGLSVPEASRVLDSVVSGLIPGLDHRHSPKHKKRAASESEHEAEGGIQNQKKQKTKQTTQEVTEDAV